MVRKSTAQVQARERARARLADKHAAARTREKATQDDLVAFLALDADTTTAADTRDAAITAAQAAYDTAVAATLTAQAGNVRAMLDRGETATDVADLTGWTTKQVRATTRPLRPAPTAGEDPIEAPEAPAPAE